MTGRDQKLKRALAKLAKRSLMTTKLETNSVLITRLSLNVSWKKTTLIALSLTGRSAGLLGRSPRRKVSSWAYSRPSRGTKDWRWLRLMMTSSTTSLIILKAWSTSSRSTYWALSTRMNQVSPDTTAKWYPNPAREERWLLNSSNRRWRGPKVTLMKSKDTSSGEGSLTSAILTRLLTQSSRTRWTLRTSWILTRVKILSTWTSTPSRSKTTPCSCLTLGSATLRISSRWPSCSNLCHKSKQYTGRVSTSRLWTRLNPKYWITKLWVPELLILTALELDPTFPKSGAPKSSPPEED